MKELGFENPIKRKDWFANWFGKGQIDLYGADLAGALLEGADLAHANLADANLADANLNHANLRNANLHNAKYNTDTKWPEGFDPQAHGAILVVEDAG